jgi:hypothetical protein
MSKVLPVHLRLTRTRRPPHPRCSASWALDGQDPGRSPGAGVLGLDAVPQPVPAPRGARQPADLRRQPVMMGRGRATGLLAVAHRGGHRLGQVLGQVGDRPVGVLGAGQDPLDVHLRPQAHHMRRARVRVLVEVCQGALPRLQLLVGVRVAVGAVDEHRGPAHIQGYVEGGPPQLEVRPRVTARMTLRSMAPRIAT